jgi:methylenetetrahydrofolate dehydrogenase (NADP+)/methenyltetrahydrofolate cyclohydrolase
MQTKIIDCQKIKEEILSKVKDKVLTLPFSPVFCDILVGDDLVSASYVRIKARTAESVGIKFKSANFPESITTEELIEKIKDLNNVPNMCGIIVQLPLPSHIDKNLVLNAIKPNLDVDCLGKDASDSFYNNTGTIKYPTALACLSILDSLNLNLSNKNIVILGQGNLVGKPVKHMLETRGIEVKTITKNTMDKDSILKNSDIIISAIGQGKFINKDKIKEGVIIIDAGTSEEDGGVIGDLDFDSVFGFASYVTSTPGGVGPVTVASLLSNIVDSAFNIYE